MPTSRKSFILILSCLALAVFLAGGSGASPNVRDDKTSVPGIDWYARIKAIPIGGK